MEDAGIVGPYESGELVVVSGKGEVDEEGENLSYESCRNGGKKKKKKKSRGIVGRHGEVKASKPTKNFSNLGFDDGELWDDTGLRFGVNVVHIPLTIGSCGHGARGRVLAFNLFFSIEKHKKISK